MKHPSFRLREPSNEPLPYAQLPAAIGVSARLVRSASLRALSCLRSLVSSSFSQALAALVLALASTFTPSCAAQAQELVPPLPSFAELEAAGARIGDIHIVVRDIFDTTDPEEDTLLFRWANTLHVHTRSSVVENALLFKKGEVVSVRLLDETERTLRANRYLYDVQFRPLAYVDGVVDIEVSTRDTWTLDPGVSAGRSGGANTGGIHLREYNLLGTGVSVDFERSSNVDRRSNEFQISDDRVFATQASLSYSHASNSDGQKNAASITRPFYALDTRQAASLSASKDDRIDSIYNAGVVVAQYRHRQTQAELFAGRSDGLVDGWVSRYSAGADLLDDAYAAEPGLAAPAQLPADDKLVSPFVRYELIEDRYEKLLNRNLIGRPEYFALGMASTIKLGWASTAWGSTRQALLYNGAVSRGFELSTGEVLITAATIAGQYSGGEVRSQHVGLQASYYLPQGSRWLFYAGASGDVLTHPNVDESLQLGGDNGLRGYPLRYQAGNQRALFTAEERTYSDLYIYRLFRIGGAVFFDVGRAWGGSDVNTLNPGWLSNAGFGLRIVSARAAFSNVLHVDLAFPLNPSSDVKKMQLLVKTKASF